MNTSQTSKSLIGTGQREASIKKDLRKNVGCDWLDLGFSILVLALNIQIVNNEEGSPMPEKEDEYPGPMIQRHEEKSEKPSNDGNGNGYSVKVLDSNHKEVPQIPKTGENKQQQEKFQEFSFTDHKQVGSFSEIKGGDIGIHDHDVTPSMEDLKKISSFLVHHEIFTTEKQGKVTDFYKIGRVLGEGGFGRVVFVEHKLTGQKRAMKQIKLSRVKFNSEQAQKMIVEVSILKRLDHPNIIKIFECYKDKTSCYLVTEMCGGGELFEKIKSLRNFSEKMAANYMKQVLSAVAYMHSSGICHRDLKPENLLLSSNDKNGQIKVIDFGVSAEVKPGEKLNKRYGTPYYIAPEVLKGEYDEKCDIWSCGKQLFSIKSERQT